MSTEPVAVTISGATIYDAAGIVTGNSFSFSSVAWDAENNKFVDATVTFSGTLASNAWTPNSNKKNSNVVIGGSFSKSHSNSTADLQIVYYDVIVSNAAGQAVQNDGATYIIGGTYSNLTIGGSTSTGGAVFRSRGKTTADVFAITQKSEIIDGKEVKKGTLINGNTATSGIGGAIHTFENGTKWYIDGATFSKNASGIVNETGQFGGGAIADQGSKYTVVQNTLFDENYAVSFGGAVAIINSTPVHQAYNCSYINNHAGKAGGAINVFSSGDLILQNCYFGNNGAGTNGGAINSLGGVVVITNVQFEGNVADANGGAIYNGIYTKGDTAAYGNMTISGATFATASDTIYNSSNCTITFGGNITLNASLYGEGTYTVDGANFTLGKGISLNGVDFSNATITVDGTNLAAGDVIATNIGGIGNYVINNKANAYLELAVVNNNLMLKEIDAAISGDVQTSYTGNGLTVMDGGEVGTLFATKGDEKEIATKISGGKVESNLVGGAYVSAGNNATVNSVELIIGGTAEVAAKVYAGGYLYGNAGDAEAAAEAQLTVDEVNINIDGGAVSTNMYGGAHARQNGNAKVDTVNITVTDGSHSRIYAGGWAEKGAESHVGISNVIISGGTVDYLYGAGANADGKTYVTTTNITVSDAAVVNTIFMGGRYGYSWVDNVNLTFAGENKELTRLSGVSSAGMDYAKATVVELETNVTADLIDYVDKFVINEGYTLTANNEFYLGNRVEGGAEPGVTTFDFITDGLDKEWTAVAGISDFTNAKFSINGSEAQLWDGDVMAIGDYTLTRNDDDKDGKYTIAIAK